MNRINNKFRQLKARGEKAFIVYLTCGYPDLSTTQRLVLEMDRVGVDIVELGVPFSDPLADGPIIQQSSQQALKKGINLRRILHLAGRIRKRSDIPLVMMSYYNPINRYGLKKFAVEAKRSGVDGLIIPDLPPEEGRDLKEAMTGAGLDLIFLVAPTSTLKRVRNISRLCSGFIYYVSLTGVTGIREKVAAGIRQGIDRVRRCTDKPVCIGFGVSNPAQVRFMRNLSDGVIVGSAIIQTMEKNRGRYLVPRTIAFIKKLLKACKS